MPKRKNQSKDARATRALRRLAVSVVTPLKKKKKTNKKHNKSTAAAFRRSKRINTIVEDELDMEEAAPFIPEEEPVEEELARVLPHEEAADESTVPARVQPSPEPGQPEQPPPETPSPPTVPHPGRQRVSFVSPVGPATAPRIEPRAKLSKCEILFLKDKAAEKINLGSNRDDLSTILAMTMAANCQLAWMKKLNMAFAVCNTLGMSPFSTLTATGEEWKFIPPNFLQENKWEVPPIGRMNAHTKIVFMSAHKIICNDWLARKERIEATGKGTFLLGPQPTEKLVGESIRYLRRKFLWPVWCTWKDAHKTDVRADIIRWMIEDLSGFQSVTKMEAHVDKFVEQQRMARMREVGQTRVTDFYDPERLEEDLQDDEASDADDDDADDDDAAAEEEVADDGTAEGDAAAAAEEVPVDAAAEGDDSVHPDNGSTVEEETEDAASAAATKRRSPKAGRPVSEVVNKDKGAVDNGGGKMPAKLPKPAPQKMKPAPAMDFQAMLSKKTNMETGRKVMDILCFHDPVMKDLLTSALWQWKQQKKTRLFYAALRGLASHTMEEIYRRHAPMVKGVELEMEPPHEVKDETMKNLFLEGGKDHKDMCRDALSVLIVFLRAADNRSIRVGRYRWDFTLLSKMGLLNSDNPKAARLRLLAILVCLILSAATRDDSCINVTVLLYKLGLLDNLQLLVDYDFQKLVDLLRPCGVNEVRARYLKEVAAILLEKHNGDVPSTVDELLLLPGVGRKTAVLVMTEGHGLCEGIGTDKWVQAATSTWNWIAKSKEGNQIQADSVECCLRTWVYHWDFKDVNPTLGTFGQMFTQYFGLGELSKEERVDKLQRFGLAASDFLHQEYHVELLFYMIGSLRRSEKAGRGKSSKAVPTQNKEEALALDALTAASVQVPSPAKEATATATRTSSRQK